MQKQEETDRMGKEERRKKKEERGDIMPNKGRELLRILAGGYLIFTGVQLARKVLASHPAHSTFFLIASGVCVAVGIWAIGISVKDLISRKDED